MVSLAENESLRRGRHEALSGTGVLKLPYLLNPLTATGHDRGPGGPCIEHIPV